MKKHSQKELLREGLWGGIKAIGRGIDYTLGKIAPEVQSLYKDPIAGAKGLVNAVKGVPPEPKQVTPAVQNAIKQGLARQNYRMSFKPVSYQSYDQVSKKHIYLATVIDQTNKEVRVYVDQNGNIMNP